MRRRGEMGWGTVAEIAVVLLVIVVLVWLIYSGSGAFREQTTCPVPDTTGQYICQKASGWLDFGLSCQEGYSRALTKFFGCNKGEICCVKDEKFKLSVKIKGSIRGSILIVDTNGDGKITVEEDEEFVPPTVTLRLYEVSADFTKDAQGKIPVQKIRELKSLSSGTSVAVFGDNTKAILVEAIVEGCHQRVGGRSVCDLDQAHFLFDAKTATGNDVLIDVADRFTTINDKKDISGGPFDLTKEMLDPSNLNGQAKDLLGIRAEYPKSAQIPAKFWTDRSFLFQFPEAFLGEKVFFNVRAIVPYKQPRLKGPLPDGAGADQQDVPDVELGEEDLAMTASASLQFVPKPAIRYGGLTSQWEKRKTITAMCEEPVTCSNVYFEIIDVHAASGLPPDFVGPPSPNAMRCPKLTLEQVKAAKRLSDPVLRRWCVLSSTGQEKECFATQQECVEKGIGTYVSPGYSSARAALIAGVQNGLIPPEVGLFFQQAENDWSVLSCQPSLPSTAAEDKSGGVAVGMNVPFLADQQPNTNIFTFTLDMPFMTEQYLCVYGQDATKQDKFYSAGKPQQIFIDRTPPVAKIRFNPWTLIITADCEDKQSGCEDYKGLAYVSSLEGFIQALVQHNNPQSAVVWCPAYATAGAYQPETRREFVYGDNALRVLCVRAVDRAGNAGVAMTTVYNGYEMLMAAVAKALQEKERHDARDGAHA
jgi:hypothetical protein